MTVAMGKQGYEVTFHAINSLLLYLIFMQVIGLWHYVENIYSPIFLGDIARSKAMVFLTMCILFGFCYAWITIILYY